MDSCSQTRLFIRNNPTKRITIPLTSCDNDFSYVKRWNSSTQCFQVKTEFIHTIQHLETHNFVLYMFSRLCPNFMLADWRVFSITLKKCEVKPNSKRYFDSMLEKVLNCVSSQGNTLSSSFIGMHFLNTLVIHFHFTACKNTPTNP